MVTIPLRYLKTFALARIKNLCHEGGGRTSDAALTSSAEQRGSTRKMGLRDFFRDQHHRHNLRLEPREMQTHEVGELTVKLGAERRQAPEGILFLHTLIASGARYIHLQDSRANPCARAAPVSSFTSTSQLRRSSTTPQIIDHSAHNASGTEGSIRQGIANSTYDDHTKREP